jgi:hypothetical protein
MTAVTRCYYAFYPEYTVMRSPAMLHPVMGTSCLLMLRQPQGIIRIRMDGNNAQKPVY